MSGPASALFGFGVGQPSTDVQILPVVNQVIAVGAPVTLDFSQPNLNRPIGPQRSVYVDNSLNDCLITCTDIFTSMTAICPPRNVGWFPLLIQPPVKLGILATPKRATILSASLQLGLCNLALEQGPTEVKPFGDPLILPFNVFVMGATVLLAGVAGQSIMIHELSLIANGNVDVKLLSGADSLTGFMPFIHGVPFVLPYSDLPHFVLGNGASLIINLDAVALVAGHVAYRQMA